MGIKLKPPYNIDNTPVYRTLDEDGILGLANKNGTIRLHKDCLLYTSPSPRDRQKSRMPPSA